MVECSTIKKRTVFSRDTARLSKGSDTNEMEVCGESVSVLFVQEQPDGFLKTPGRTLLK